MKISVASENPVKLEAVLQGIRKLFQDCDFEMTGRSVPSGVRKTPLSDEETKQGARNRVQALKALDPEADIWIAIEAGCMEEKSADDKMHLKVASWVVALDKNGHHGEEKSFTARVPDEVADLVRQGMGLGKANDAVFGTSNSKQHGGALSLWTDNAICRVEECVQPVIAALMPIKYPDRYNQHRF